MKPFLGIDITTDKKNEKVNGDEFLSAVPSSPMTQSFEQSSDNAEETINRSQLPLPLRIIQFITGLTAGLFAISLLKSLAGADGVSITDAYKNGASLFWIAGICLLVWGVLKLSSMRKEKEVLDSDEADHVFSNFNNVCNSIYSELSVPPDAKEVDILSFFYKMKDGRIKVCEKAMQMAPYLNLIFRVYRDSDNLYIANLEGKYAFPLSSLISIHTVKKHIRLISWNKNVPFNNDNYKQYKITSDNYGCIHCKYYHILEIDQGGESLGIYIPNYELPIFEELTSLKAE